MSDPTLKMAKVVVKYSADDSYSSEAGYGGAGKDPQQALIAAAAELGRLTALFKCGDQAKAEFDAAQARVAEFFANRETK